MAKTIITIAIAVVFVAIFLIVISPMAIQSIKENSEKNLEVEKRILEETYQRLEKESQSKTPPQYQIGEQVILDNISYRVLTSPILLEGDIVTRPDGTFYSITLELENLGKSQQTVEINQFILADGKKRLYELQWGDWFNPDTDLAGSKIVSESN